MILLIIINILWFWLIIWLLLKYSLFWILFPNIWFICSKEKFDLVKQALNKNIRYLYQYDYFKQTPIHWAAKLGYEKMLEMFLSYTRRCNIYDKNGRTPLYIAALNNQKRCVELLLDKGGNPFLTDKDGKKPEDVTTNTDIKILLQTTSEKPFNELNKEVFPKRYESNIIIM